LTVSQFFESRKSFQIWNKLFPTAAMLQMTVCRTFFVRSRDVTRDLHALSIWDLAAFSGSWAS